MIIIPAVDIKGGNCVRLIQGKPSMETVYSSNPLDMAKQWEDRGAKRLHVVDLDGAFEGKMKNMEVILKIAESLDIPVEVGGGIRDYETVKNLINGGIYRVILGTSAIYDQEFLKDVIKEWPDKIIVGIDSIRGQVAVKGWQYVSSRTALELAVEMESTGVNEIIVTDITKDGMLEGTNTELIKDIAEKVKISIIASGGVTSLEDIKKLKALNLENLTGVIIGKALYSGNLEITEVIKIAENGE